MEIFRYSRNVYGQSTLEGVSFELVWVFIGVAAVIIVGHLLWSLFARPPGGGKERSNA
jgi:hypothetical protein